MIGEFFSSSWLPGYRLLPSEHMVDRVEDWSRVRSPARALRRRRRYRQNIAFRVVPKQTFLLVSEASPPIIIGHPETIDKLLESLESQAVNRELARFAGEMDQRVYLGTLYHRRDI